VQVYFKQLVIGSGLKNVPSLSWQVTICFGFNLRSADTQFFAVFKKNLNYK